MDYIKSTSRENYLTYFFSMWTSVSPAWLESRSGSKSKRYTYEDEEKDLVKQFLEESELNNDLTSDPSSTTELKSTITENGIKL